MPYVKEVGQSPRYRLGYISRDFDLQLSHFLTRVNVPHWAPGITYQDSFDAYVERAAAWAPLERWKRSTFQMVYD